MGEITKRSSDKIVSYGELLSAYLISEFFISEGLDARYKDTRELIKTNSTFGKAVVDFSVTNTNIHYFFQSTKSSITIVPGFISSSFNGDTTTLGRGGSDYTAAIIANAVHAEALEIWTDVNGMYTANPKLVKQAKTIKHISYEEAMELSHFGAKVLYPPTIQPVLNAKIPIYIKNTFNPKNAGSCISETPMEKNLPSAV